MAEQTQNLADFAGSIPPLPVPEGTTAREEAAARWLNDAHRGYWGWEDAIGDARDLLATVDGPGPDWSDLREMARNAGWTRTIRSGQCGVIWWSNWKYLAPEGRGRVSVTYHSIEGWGFTIVNSPDDVSLQDPTPAKVLAAARLLGLVGAS